MDCKPLFRDILGDHPFSKSCALLQFKDWLKVVGGSAS